MMGLFTATRSDRRAKQQLEEAKLQRLEHRAAAEFNTAMADMLDARIERLEAVVNTAKEAQQ